MATDTLPTSSPPETQADARAALQSSSAAGTGRVSETPGRSMLQAGGLGYIARRGVPFRVAQMLTHLGGVELMAQFEPLSLLVLMADTVPEISNAVWNFLLLGCAPGTVRLKAVTADADGNSEEAPDGTAAINAFFEQCPQESGDFDQQLAQNVLMTLFSAMAATEAVPGPELTGLTASYPVDTLTLSFRRAPTGELVLDQRQGNPSQDSPDAFTGINTNMVPMPMPRFFWYSMHRFPGDSYGRAPFGALLTPILEYLGFIRDLTIAFHRLGMPRYDVEFDWEAAILFATKVQQYGTAAEIAASVKKQFQDFQANFNNLETDDTFFHGVGTKVNVTGSAAEMPDVEGIFDIYRYRVVLALKQNPVLMSFVEGSTETWSDVQWELATAALQAVVTPGVSPLKDTARLHLRLLGLAYKVEAEFTNPRSISRLEDAQAEQIEIANEAAKRDEGWQTQDTASQAITGSGAVADAQAPPASPPQMVPDGKGGVKPGPTPVAPALPPHKKAAAPAQTTTPTRRQVRKQNRRR